MDNKMEWKKLIPLMLLLLPFTLSAQHAVELVENDSTLTVTVHADSLGAVQEMRSVPTAKVIVDTLKSLVWKVQSKSASFTIEDHVVYLVDASSDNITISLPAGVLPVCAVLKRIDDGTSGMTVAVDGTVDGTTEPTLAGYESEKLITDGTNWYFISDFD